MMSADRLHTVAWYRGTPRRAWASRRPRNSGGILMISNDKTPRRGFLGSIAAEGVPYSLLTTMFKRCRAALQQADCPPVTVSVGQVVPSRGWSCYI